MSKESNIIAKTKVVELQKYYDIQNTFEIGIDESGRGPMFGRLYVAGVILPKDDSFLHKNMKDSKRIKSHKKMGELSNYIKENAISWHIHYVEAEQIDEINIRQAVLFGMRECVSAILEKKQIHINDVFLLVDGNDFQPYVKFDETTQELQTAPHTTVIHGDNTYTSIAAASILAKYARDEYILELCSRNPYLVSKYHLDTNMGYGTKNHIQGIQEYGITQWHRRSYGICKTSPQIELYSMSEDNEV
jgi:ribonuclease HII